MNPANKAELAGRIAAVAEHALSTRQVVIPLDVLIGIGWLPPVQVEAWRRGRVPYLERVAEVNLARLSTALRLLGDWARRHDLTASETVYVAWTRDRHPLRFTKTGDRHTERSWRTHWISPALTEAKRARRTRQQKIAYPRPHTRAHHIVRNAPHTIIAEQYRPRLRGMTAARLAAVADVRRALVGGPRWCVLVRQSSRQIHAP